MNHGDLNIFEDFPSRAELAFDISPFFFEIYFLWWIFLILEFVVCALMRACMPDRLPKVANAILV